MFSIAETRGISAWTVRGISDDAGIDNNKFETETGGSARRIAVLNAGTFAHEAAIFPSGCAYISRERA